MQTSLTLYEYLKEGKKMSELDEQEKVAMETKVILLVIVIKDQATKLRFRCLVRKIVSTFDMVVKSYSTSKLSKLVSMNAFSILFSKAYENNEMDEIIRENKTYALNYEAYSQRAERMYRSCRQTLALNNI